MSYGLEGLNAVPAEVLEDTLRSVQSESRFIANKVCPPLQVASGYVNVTFGSDYDLASYAGIDPVVGYSGTVVLPDHMPDEGKKYNLIPRAYGDVLDAGEYARNPLSALRTALGGMFTRLSVDNEKALAAVAGDTSLWTGSFALAAGDKWADATSKASNSSADPARDIARMAEGLDSRGQDVDTILVSGDVLRAMQIHPALASFARTDQDRNFLSPETVRGILASIFQLDSADRVFIGRAVQNTAGQGKTGVYGGIHSNYIWAGRCLPAPSELLESPDFSAISELEDGSHRVFRSVGLIHLQRGGINTERSRLPLAGYAGTHALRAGILDIYGVGDENCGITMTGIFQ